MLSRINMTREQALEKYGYGIKIYVGTGKEAAKKVIKLGAGNKIRTMVLNGLRDYYIIRKKSLPWDSPAREFTPNVDMQKVFNRAKIVVGIGYEPAVKALKMGAGRQTCQRIYNGEQDFFYPCYNVKTYEITGFNREITIEIADKVKNAVAMYTWDEFIAKDVAQEVLIQIAAKKDIVNFDSFVRALSKKYVSLFFKTNGFMRQKTNGIYIEDYKDYLGGYLS